MADHGEVEYATATGNDLPAHEATYKNFVQLAYVGSCHVVSIVIGLAIVGITGALAASPSASSSWRRSWRIHGLATGAQGAERRHGGDLAARARARRRRLSADRSCVRRQP